MKKAFSVLLTILLIISLLPLSAMTVSAATVDDLTYMIEDGAVTITGCQKSVSGELVIPSEIEGVPVTAIGYGAFEKCTGLTSVTIPDSVTLIGKWAFASCSNLASITIPDNMTSIGGYAFSYTACFNNPSNWENGVLYIGNHLIEANPDVLFNDYCIREGTKTIAGGAFAYCIDLMSITIPNSVISIGDYAFAYCRNLIDITIPDSVTTIGESSFYDCTSLQSVYLPNSVTSLGDDVFCDCTSLSSITIPDSVTSIGSGVFEGCSSLWRITISEGLTSIDWHMFNGCSNLMNITIPDSVTEIGWYAFYNCSILMNITIPDSVTAIGQEAFFKCSSLTGITIPDSVTEIGERAFYGCNNLTIYCGEGSYAEEYAIENEIPYIVRSLSVVTVDDLTYTISNGTVTITDCAESASGSLVIPAEIEGVPVTEIGYGAFEYGTGLTSVTIPDSVTLIGDMAFFGCDSLTRIVVADDNPIYHSSGNCLINTQTKTLIAGCQNSQIPADGSVTAIDDGAFYGCTRLTNITIPDGVTKIGASAFSGCSRLFGINIPNGVTEIGNFAFENCIGLSSMSIPDGMTEIGQYAFYGCSRLASINIPDSVTHIGDCAFLKTFYSSDPSNWEDGVLYIDNHLIQAKGRVLSNHYTIREGTKTIAQRAFYDCGRLTSVAIPDSVITIGNGAFSYCGTLTTVTIPDSVTSIGDYAFEDCNNLTIRCQKGSYADQYAVRNNITVSYVEDFSGDGVLDGQDVAVLRQNLLTVWSDPASAPSAADLNGDGVVDIKDLVRLQKTINA